MQGHNAVAAVSVGEGPRVVAGLVEDLAVPLELVAGGFRDFRRFRMVQRQMQRDNAVAAVGVGECSRVVTALGNIILTVGINLAISERFESISSAVTGSIVVIVYVSS